jgi:GH25 family lysozyme M1 (1,4-beta-N-acetylmuramidase)
VRLTDRRLYQARNLEDFAFRYWLRDEDNQRRRNATREQAGLVVTQQDKQNFVVYGSTPFVAPDTNRIWGPDVSDWDGAVNFQTVKDFGADFAIIKAMDGTVPTRYWEVNHQRANDCGLPHGPYAWLYPDNRVNCTLQAKAYYNLIKGAKIQLPPVIDFEWTRYAGVQANPNYTDLRRWVAPFIQASGVKPILYSAAGYMNMFGRMPDDLRAMFAGFHFASYGGTRPIYPIGFTEYDLWQFTASGDALALCPGDRNKKELDLNYMTESFFNKYVRAIPPTEPQTGETMKGKVLKFTNIRAQNTQYSTDVGDLLTGDLVEWTEEVSGSDGLTWIKLISATHNGAPVRCSDGGTVAGRYCWANNVEEIVTPPAQELKVPDYLIAHFADGTSQRYLPE